MESLPGDIKIFDDNLSELLNLSKKIIKCHEARNLKLSSQRNPVLSRLENYIKTYDKTEPEDHIWHFQKIFTNNKPAILRGPGRDNWIKNGSLLIQFGEDVGKPSQNIKIHLTSIYTTACKLRDEMGSSLKGLPNSDQSEELSYPSLMLLHLYKIFHEISDDKETLLEHIKTLEQEIGIKNKSSKAGGADPLGGILGTVTDLMGQMGVKLPEGQKMPSQDELGKMLGNMMNNPQTKSLIGNVMQEMKECKSIGDVVNKLVNNLGVDAGTKQTLQENLNNASSMFTQSSGGNGSPQGSDIQHNNDIQQGDDDEDDFVQ